MRIIFTDDAGNDESLTSEATAAVTASNTLATGEPTITGTAQVGEELTADTTDISDSDGLINASFTYRWLADDTDITDATGSTYTLAAADEGKAIKVRITFTDDAGNDESLTSEATCSSGCHTHSVATGAPAISGTVQVGTDADRINIEHIRQRRADQRDLHLPVDRKRWDRRHGYPGRDRFYLHCWRR